MAIESPAASQLTGGTLSIKECRNGLMKGLVRLTIQCELDPELSRSVQHHDDPVLNLEARILQASLDVMYSSALDATKHFAVAAGEPPDIWAGIGTQFAWIAKHGLALALDESGQTAASMAAATDAADIAMQAGHRRLAAISRSMLGQTLSRQGYANDGALSLVELAEDVLIDDRTLRLNAYYLARVYEREGDIEGAVSQMVAAANSPVAELAFDGYQVGLARLLGKVGRIDDARSALATGRAILRQRGEPPKVRSRYLLADAQIRLANGDLAQAARRATWAKAGFERGGFSTLAQAARVLVARAQLGLGNPTSAIATLAEGEPANIGPFERLEVAKILVACYIALDDQHNEVMQLREAARLSEQLRLSAQTVAQMERLVADRAEDQLRTVVAEAERDRLQVRQVHDGEAIAMICHDLRGSLNIVTLAAESLAPTATDSPLKKQLLDSVDSMDRIVTQLNSVTELDQTMRQLASEPVDINDVCDSVVERILPLAATRNIALATTEHGRGCTVDGDVTAVERILSNFITNAIDNCPSGTSIDLRLSSVDPSTVRIAVVDDGPGIDGDDMETVFHKFVSSRNRSTPASTGLGLYIARKLAHSMGGEVGIEPGDNGIGCCFWLELPCATSD